MEDTLRDVSDTARCALACLNPCFNGRYSQRRGKAFINFVGKVLILVLMEDTLRGLS